MHKNLNPGMLINKEINWTIEILIVGLQREK